MSFQDNQRNENRFKHDTMVLIEIHQTGKYYQGRMRNYSTCGACIHSDCALQPGTDIFIGIENSPYSWSHDVFRAKVVWCNPRSEECKVFGFCIGAKYY